MKKFVIAFLSFFILIGGALFAKSKLYDDIPNNCSNCGAKFDTSDLKLEGKRVRGTCRSCGSSETFELTTLCDCGHEEGYSD